MAYKSVSSVLFLEVLYSGLSLVGRNLMLCKDWEGSPQTTMRQDTGIQFCGTVVACLLPNQVVLDFTLSWGFLQFSITACTFYTRCDNLIPGMAA